MGVRIDSDLPRHLRRGSAESAARAASGSEEARSDRVAIAFGATVRAVDGQALGRLRRVGLDPFGHVSALMTARCVYPAAAMRSASERARTIVVDPAERRCIVVVRELGPATSVWCTDDAEFRLLGVRLAVTGHEPASIVVRRRRHGEVRELRWSTVFVDGDGLPVAMYCRQRTDGRRPA